jgi:hypothetical protein
MFLIACQSQNCRIVFGREMGKEALIPAAWSLIMTRGRGIGGMKTCFLRLLKMKSKENFAFKRANDNKLTNVELLFMMPAVTIRTRFRAFVLNVPSIKRVQSDIKR